MTEPIQENLEKKPIVEKKASDKKEFTSVLTVEEVKALKSDPKNKGPRERYIDWLRQRDSEIVRGKFIFHEIPGGALSFSFGPMYPGDQTERYDMVDGEICSVPLGVARHLNKECKYPVHTFKMDENNKAQIRVNNWVRRVSFQSLEFIDTEDLNPVGTGHRR
jgi:hypothetical protein